MAYGIAVVDDLDRDGEADLATLVSVPDGTTHGRQEVWFLSSRDGAFLPARLTPNAGETFNAVRDGADFDGDGRREFLIYGVIAGQGGIHVIDCHTLVRRFRLTPVPGIDWGYRVVTDLDVDGNGSPDIVVSAPGNAELYVYDHVGSLRYITRSLNPGVVWGPSVNRFPDLDGDGCDDFVVGIGELTTAGGAEVVSGRTGLSLVRVVGPQPGDYLGAGVAACGDMDGDGMPDIAAGGGAIGSPGTVQVFSSRTRQRIHAWYTGGSHDGFGEQMIGDLDIDQDGVADMVATALGEPVSPSNPNVRSTLHVYSGRDGTRLMRFSDPFGLTSSVGFYLLTAVPPRLGSTLPRFAAPGPWWGYDPTTLPFYRGKIWMFEGGPVGTSTVAPPCAGTLPHPPRIGLRSLSPTATRITLSDAEPGALALLVLGLSPAASPLSLDLWGFRGCVLTPSIDAFGVLATGVQGLAAGYTCHDIPRGVSATTGMAVLGQWIALGSGAGWPGGTTATLRWTLQ